MGYERHDAIVVTSWNREQLAAAAAKAREIGLEVLGPSTEVTNGFATFLVCPDGSKEGWAESNEHDTKRSALLAYMNGVRYEDGSTCLSWVAVVYSGDDGGAAITAHAWEKQPAAGAGS